MFYYYADGEGSIRLLTNASGAIVNRYEYDSYGKRLQAVEAVRQPYTWKGREYIAGLDMYYNRMRFYDPQMGRFIQEDPIHFRGGDTNLFAFGWNNPKNWNDPSGLTSGGETSALSGIMAGALLNGATLAARDFATRAAVAAAKSAGVQYAASTVAALAVTCTMFTLADAIAIVEDTVVVDVDPMTCSAKRLKGKRIPKPIPVPQPIVRERPETCSQDEHDTRQNEINRSCKPTPPQCKSPDPQLAAQARYCAMLRQRQLGRCFGSSGGDNGHRQALAEAWALYASCR